MKTKSKNTYIRPAWKNLIAVTLLTGGLTTDIKHPKPSRNSDLLAFKSASSPKLILRSFLLVCMK